MFLRILFVISKYLIFVFILFIPGFKTLAQQKLIKKTNSVVDTSQNKIEQVKDIYEWITNNIKYDTQQLKKGNKYYSATQTLRRKKAICYGYSELFHEMCKVLNIEAYTINGYCKGFGYTEKENFIKSNHTWNVVNIDSNLIIVDATWGSGTLSYEYSVISKFKNFIKKEAGIKNKIIFYPSASLNYFDISPVAIISTHFPLDAKWQLQEYPISYNSFISGEYGTSGYLNYSKEISQIKYLDSKQQYFIDALNSTQYNPFNKFDIAYQYFLQASNLNVSKNSPLDSVLLKQLYQSKGYCDSAIVYLEDFKGESRDFFYQKKQNQKVSCRIGANALKQIYKIPTSINGRFEKEYRKLEKTELKLNEIAGKIYPLGLFINQEIQFSYQPNEFSDSIQLRNIKEGLRDKYTKVGNYISVLNVLKEELEKEFNSDVGLSDSIISQVIKIAEYQSEICISLESMNEYQVLLGCRKMGSEILKYDSILEKKQNIQESIEKYVSQIEKKYDVTERALNSMLGDYDKLAKVTGENEFYAKRANKTLTLLYELYSFKFEMLKNLQLGNEDWQKLLTAQNQILTRENKEGCNYLSNNLDLFYKYISKKNDSNYLNEKNLYIEIKNESKRRILAINKLIKEAERVLNMNQ